MSKARFEEVLKSKLQQPQPNLTAPSWQEMERRMQQAQPLGAEQAPHQPHYWRRAMGYVAAAVMLLSVGSALLFRELTQRPIVTPYHADNSTQQELSELPLPGIDEAVTAEFISETSEVLTSSSPLTSLLRSARTVQGAAPQKLPATSDSSLSRVIQALIEQPTSNTALPFTAANETPESEIEAEQSRRPSERHLGPSLDEVIAQEEYLANRRNSRRRWTVAAATTAFFADAGGGSNQGVLYSAPNSFIHTTKDQSIETLQEGSLRNRPTFDGADMQHQFPVSAGISARYAIGERLSLESGLIYSYLRSNATKMGEYAYDYQQNVHYLGIPLHLSYSLIRAKRWDAYVSGGFMAEIALSAQGRLRSYYNGELLESVPQQLGAGGLLWSANAAVGIDYTLADQFAIYFEPGVSYYFPNENQPYTYRTDNPWGFTMRLGFRVKF